MEYFLFPKKSYYLTQGYGNKSYSHKYRKAIDVSSRGSNDKKIYAPFTGYVAKIYIKKDNAYSIWLVSNEKVICADGQKRYAVMMLTHPNDIINYKVNDKFKQNDLILHDGTTGKVAAHLDLEIALYDKREKIDINWHYTKMGYGLNNSVNPSKYILLSNDAKVYNELYKVQNKKYHLKKVSEIYFKYKTLYNMNIRSFPGVNNPKKGLYKKGTVITINNITNDNGSIWGKTTNGYVCLKANNIEYCKLL